MINNKIRKIAILITALSLVSGATLLSGCGKKDNLNVNEKSSSQEKSDEKKSNESKDNKINTDEKTNSIQEQTPSDENNTSSNSNTSTQNEQTKYGNAEVYIDANGNKAAKTEDGTEVELTSDNMQKLMNEYAKVKGSGSDEEKKLLAQLQVIIEVQQAQSGN